jgi:hypothetical protein
MTYNDEMDLGFNVGNVLHVLKGRNRAENKGNPPPLPSPAARRRTLRSPRVQGGGEPQRAARFRGEPQRAARFRLWQLPSARRLAELDVGSILPHGAFALCGARARSLSS